MKIAVDYSYQDFGSLFGKTSLPVTRMWYDCPYGSSINVFGYTGTITCPSANEPACLGGNEPDWPLISSVDPSSGVEGATITISGSYFTASLVVYIGDTKSKCSIVSNTTITCKLGDSPNLKGQNIPVFIADGDNDRSSVAPFSAFHYCEYLCNTCN
jgi:hypothetical protein